MYPREVLWTAKLLQHRYQFRPLRHEQRLPLHLDPITRPWRDCTPAIRTIDREIRHPLDG